MVAPRIFFKRLILGLVVLLAVSAGGVAPVLAATLNHLEHRYASRFSHWPRGHRQMLCLDPLWHRESDWNPWAVNRYSGAYGIPQALGHGHPYPLGKYRPQIRWGVRYIKHRYGTACAAWRHEEGYGWY